MKIILVSKIVKGLDVYMKNILKLKYIYNANYRDQHYILHFS